MRHYANSRTHTSLIISVLILTFLAAVFFLLVFLSHNNVINMDIFYHMGLARQALREGLVQGISQADDIAWSVNFVNKEYIYHLLVTAFFWSGGPMGVIAERCRGAVRVDRKFLRIWEWLSPNYKRKEEVV